jgi:radical SAM protein with 4Fe4S-binding SPASM domain
MRELEYRIVLTEKCNAACEHCFNKKVRNGREMDVDKFVGFIQQNRHAVRNKQLKIMGGEPTIHPRFTELVEKTINYFDFVRVFTNGITLPQIVKNPLFDKNERIGYTVNGYTFDPSKFEKYRNRVLRLDLHFVIPYYEPEKIIKKILNCVDFMRGQVTILYSPDTQVNIFDPQILDDYRKTWMDAIKVLVPQLRQKNVLFAPDHTVPACFFTTEMIDELAEIDFQELSLALSCCDCENLGLIDTEFNLLYCNQTRIKLGSLLNDDGTFKTMNEVEAMIAKGPRTKCEMTEQISKKCKDCSALPLCRVGCYYNTLARNHT